MGEENINLTKGLQQETVKVNAIEEEIWQFFFDGASRMESQKKMVAGMGLVFVSPYNHIIPRVYSLTSPCSNNIVEYNALMVDLKIAKQQGVKYLEVYGDSNLSYIKLEENMKSEIKTYYHIIKQ